MVLRHDASRKTARLFVEDAIGKMHEAVGGALEARQIGVLREGEQAVGEHQRAAGGRLGERGGV